MKLPTLQSDSVRYLVVSAIILLLLIAGSFYFFAVNFLFAHVVTELFTVIIGIVIFIITWNARKYIENGFIIITGIAYLFVGIFDVFHMLTYKDMNIFHGITANMPTQLWIIARYIESISIFAAALFIGKKVSPCKVLFVFLFASVLVALSLTLVPIFPDCYIEGQGLTLFKVASEYLISLLLVGAVLIIASQNYFSDKVITRYIIISILLTIAGELFFTFYVSVFGISNVLGHGFKIASFYYLYRAVVVSGIRRPQAMLYTKLQEALEEKEMLLSEIHHRVKNNLNMVTSLISIQSQEVEDQKTQEMFQDLISRVDAIAAIHQIIYTKKVFGCVDISSYARQLVGQIVDSMAEQDVRVDFHLEEASCLQKEAVNFGIILSELVTNALKYGFRGAEQPVLTVYLYQDEQGMLKCSVENNGEPIDTSIITASKSLGFTLVKNLAENMQGSVEITGDKGTTVTFSLMCQKC
ncbi:MAG: MASE3 domain-containing protein [Spirochaetia bacterium]